MKINQIDQSTYQQSFNGTCKRAGTQMLETSSKVFDKVILQKILGLKSENISSKGHFLGTFIDTIDLTDGTRIDFDSISGTINIVNTSNLEKPLLPKAFFEWLVKQEEWVDKRYYKTLEENPLVEKALEHLKSLIA